MKIINKQGKTMKLKRTQDDLRIDLTFSYLYENNKEIGASIEVNNSCEMIFDSIDEMHNTKLNQHFFKEMLWKYGNREEISKEEANELSSVVLELVHETNTGINQFYIIDSKELNFFEIIY